jgi:hypothetical protein
VQLRARVGCQYVGRKDANHTRGMQMTGVRGLNRDTAKQMPESVFESPLEIVNEILLTKGEKLATLNQWRLSILGELDASNEGMTTLGYASEQLTVLEAIEQANARLKRRQEPETSN